MGLIIDLQHMFHRKLGITLRGGEALVTEQLLNGAQVGALFEHVRAEGVAKRVGMNVG